MTQIPVWDNHEREFNFDNAKLSETNDCITNENDFYISNN